MGPRRGELFHPVMPPIRIYLAYDGEETIRFNLNGNILKADVEEERCHLASNERIDQTFEHAIHVALQRLLFRPVRHGEAGEVAAHARSPVLRHAPKFSHSQRWLFRPL